MKSSIILTFFLKLFCDKDEDLVKINTALLLKNNFWGNNEILEDNNKKSLKLVIFNVWNSDQMDSIVKFNENDCKFNPNDEKFYYLINLDITKIILSHLKEKKDVFLKFDYIFEHSQSENESSTSNNASKLLKNYSTYYDFKTLTYTNEKFVFKDDNIFLNKYHIKIIMSKLIEWKSCYINNLDSLLNNQFEDQTAKFTLLYFESLSSCFENFKKFVDFLNWRKNKKIDSNVIKEKNSSENYKSILKISELKRNLNKMFNANYNEVNEEGKQAVYFNGKSRFLFNKLLNKLKVLLSQKIVFLPIGGIYTKQFYFDRIYGQIHRLILNLYDEVRPYFHKFPLSLYDKYVCEFEIFIKHLSSSIIFDVWESLDIEKYVANFLGKENLDVEDYTKANNIFSDFHNMILFILAKRNLFVDVFSKAIFVDTTLINKFKCDLFWAYEITFKDSVVFGEIKAYNIEGNEINFEKDIDFYEPLQRDKKIIVLIETIRRKKIEKIEVFSTEKLLLKGLIFQEKSKKQKSWWDSLCSKLGYS